VSSPKPRYLAVAAAVAALALAACGSGPTTSPASPALPSASPTPPTQPLTGLPLAADDPSARRPALFIKVENAYEARPQSGLDKADVVYEELVEGGMSRFAAIFQSRDPGEVGPVRSVRPMDPPLAAPLKGLAAFSGGIGPFIVALDEVAQDLSAEKLGEAPPYHRAPSRVAPHNLYVNAKGLWPKAGTPYNRPPLPLFEYGPLPDAGARPAGAVRMSFSDMDQDSRNSWRWDGRAWNRLQNGRPFTVAGSGILSATNVLIERVLVHDTPYIDAAGLRVPESIVVGSGNGTLLRDGKATDVTWSKPRPESPTDLMSSSGQPVKLKPGTAWVELVPVGLPVTVTS